MLKLDLLTTTANSLAGLPDAASAVVDILFAVILAAIVLETLKLVRRVVRRLARALAHSLAKAFAVFAAKARKIARKWLWKRVQETQDFLDGIERRLRE